MSTNEIRKNIKQKPTGNRRKSSGNSKNVKNRNKNRKKKKKKSKLKVLISFFMFEFIFTAATAPFTLLYGPFENAKSTYVGAAMTSMNHQYLAQWFLSDEKINEILNANSSDSASDATTEITDLSEINIPKVKDETIEFYELTENTKYGGYYLIVKDPTRIHVGITSNLYVEGETTSQIAENYDAVAAVNGGAFTDQSSDSKWTGNGGTPSGIIMSYGEVIHNDLGKGNKTDLLAMTESGKMIVGKYCLEDLEGENVKEILSFGPSLVINGKMTPMSGDGGWGIAPRTVIGQRKDGAIILLVIDGRSASSVGATLKEAQEVIYKLGAVNAINLDGGKSTTMYYEGEIRNTPSYSMGERAIPTAIIVK